MMSFAGKIFAAGLLFFSTALMPTLAFARDIEITVIDGDLSIPLEGARVVSPDGGEKICDVEGRTLVSVPDDRSVVLRISYPGYAPGRVSVPPGADAYTVELSLAGTAEERELIVEAPRPGSSETVIGRSVAISGDNLTMPAETGIIGDVMNAVKLLPGVGYVGGYMAMPSVRGGEPSDVTAVFDGFYVERPYHWGGAFSIFDPKMVESAQLSHGVFSTRYGHTVSGLLDIHAKRPSPESAGLELAVSSSATNLNLSFPLGEKGGLSLMGKVTYWDPFVETAKLFFEEVRYVSTTPFIRSGAFGAAYDLSADLSLSFNGFFGNDGVGVHYDDDSSTSIYDADFFWDNKIGFLVSGLGYSPNSRSLVKVTLGAGLLQSDLDGHTYSENITKSTTREYDFFVQDRTVNFQGRADYDLDLGNGFLFAAGAEERYSRWDRINTFRGRVSDDPVPDRERTLNVLNQGLLSSAYSLFEYSSENRRFGMEAGIRGDHFLLAGEGYTLPGIPALNPRINFDFLLLEDSGPFESITMTAGTGLFSSVNSSLQNISSANNIKRDASTQNRSWTTVAGTKIDLLSGFSFTFEGYFKYVFNRAYT
ncbi:MAG: TonB-dependent receptor plug domain-containing protein, partial [Treponema sp.]|nr:TonB-dependent receptor plug domain-containing protein [Treponema sp.]